MGRPTRAKKNAGAPMAIRVVSRRLVKAGDTSIQPHVSAVHNIDLIPNSIQGLVTCVYPKPAAGDFSAVVAAFDAHLPSFLNYFFPLTGRIVFSPTSSLPELHCLNQGTELVVGEVDVDLGSLDWGLSESSLKKIYVPYAEELPLSVQVISFACGGFAVVWATNNLIGDGNVGVMLVRMWSELVRTGSVVSEEVPSHDRSLLGRPRSPPTYGREVAEMFRPWEHEQEVNALTAEESLIERLYYVDGRDLDRLRAAASADNGQPPATRVQAFSAYLWKVLAGVVDASRRLPDADKRCRLLWWVDGRRRFSSPELRAALRAYAGNVTLYVVAEADAKEVLRRPLPEVAGMVRDAITGRDYDELAQGLTDWVEVNKPRRFIETSTIGLGSPTVAQTMWSSFPTDTDFGFGQAALVLPVDPAFGRMCSGLLCIAARPGDGGGSWILSAEVWPRLAAALEEDDERIVRPLTAEYLGLSRASYLLRERQHATAAAAAATRPRL